MDLFSRLERLNESARLEGAKAAELSSLVGGPGVVFGDIPPYRKSSELLGSSVGWVYACAGVIADELASIRIRLYRNKNREIEEVENHPALDLLYRANDFTTKFDLFWLTAQYLELTGEAPWFISSDGRQPSQILLLRPDAIKVKPGAAGKIIGGYRYTVGGHEVDLAPEEVVFLRYPDPDRQFRGRGPLQAAARAFDLEQFSEEYNRRFFYNSARPDGVLQTEQKLGRDQLTTLERKLSQKFKGIENAHKTLILEKGLKWEPMALSQKDMEFVAQSGFARDKILGIFRVPRTVLGLTDDVNRANAEATDYVFARRTIKPKMERIVQQLNEFLLSKFAGTEGMFFDFDNPVPDDELRSLELQKAALQAGWLTINEVRALDGYDPIDDEEADKLRVPVTHQPLGEASPFSFESAPAPDFSERLRAMKARGRRAELIRKRRGAIQKALAGQFRVILGRDKKRKLKKAKTEDEAKALAFQAKQLNIASNYEKRFVSAMNRVFRAQRDEVLGKMPQKSRRKQIDPRDFLLLPESEKRRYIKEFGNLIVKLLADQSAEAFEFVDVKNRWDIESPAIQKYLKTGFRFSFHTTRLTNRLLAASLVRGIGDGESIVELRRRVERVFTKMERYRSERIARSETIRISNYASEEAYRESGVVEAKEWLTALDERTCEWCGPMNGKILGFGENWFKRGERVTGNQGGVLSISYGNVGYPPLHPNCRCTLIPVVFEPGPQPERELGLEEAERKAQEILNNESAE